jgi:hypothetical protein
MARGAVAEGFLDPWRVDEPAIGRRIVLRPQRAGSDKKGDRDENGAHRVANNPER